MTHTPGPWAIGPADWQISQATGMGYRNFPIRAPEGFDVAMVYSDEDDAEQQANVHLVAAAPELMAALRGVLHWAECECKRLADDTPADDDPPMCDYCVAKLAIAKAEGRSK